MEKKHLNANEFITISQLARFLGISRIAVYKKVKKGEIEATKVGNIFLIPKSYISEIQGKSLSSRKKKIIDKAVKKAVKDYGEVLIRLGNE
jgi:excisionase family DNA binding protein